MTGSLNSVAVGEKSMFLVEMEQKDHITCYLFI